jgi:hypothetical protein
MKAAGQLLIKKEKKKKIKKIVIKRSQQSRRFWLLLQSNEVPNLAEWCNELRRLTTPAMCVIVKMLQATKIQNAQHLFAAGTICCCLLLICLQSKIYFLLKGLSATLTGITRARVRFAKREEKKHLLQLPRMRIPHLYHPKKKKNM